MCVWAFGCLTNMTDYDSNLDREYLERNGIKIVEYRPWQFGLFHPEIEGKFVWYPKKGTLMYEKSEYNNKKIGEFHTSQDVLEKIKELLVK